MIPQRSLIQPPQGSAFLSPDATPITNLTDYQLGGIGLANPSQGLQVQNWFLEVLGTGTGTYIQISALNTSPIFMFTSPNITWARLAFDQNMHPFIAFINQTGPGYWWYDPLIPGQTFVFMTSDVTNPCCTMDDKRPLETRLGTNDIILAYTRIGNLFYRQQRDRYQTEYLLYTNINTILPNPTLNKIGMGAGNRLQFQIYGSLYQ